MDNIPATAFGPTMPLRHHPWYSWKRLGLNFLTLSILAHLLFGFGATYLIVQTIQAKRRQTFAAGPQSPAAPTRALEHKVQMQKKQQTMSAPPAVKRITTTSNSKVALPAMPAMPKMDSTITPMTMAGMGGTGTGLGMGGGGSGGGGFGAPINFFGFRTSAKRIAFLVDYSGSMTGPFRQKMETNLEASLAKLPTGTQILVIPWAGPAWLYNQKAKDIMDKWQKLDAYDNFAIKPGATLTPPSWVSISPQTVSDLMKGIKAQEAAGGGTDWRQPFRYAMQVQPPPDVIFFMTDCQIPDKTAPRALAAIDAALKKVDHVPQVNCLWIENKRFKPDLLRRLAGAYHGQFLEVKE